MSGARRLLLAATVLAAGLARAAAPAAPVVMRTDDVERFYRLYDDTHGHPTAAQLQAQYLDPGSEALHQFVTLRIGDATQLAKAIEKRPADFAQARTCLPALARTRSQLPAVFARYAELYPAATFPPIAFLVGRDSTGGTTSRDGVLIGLETMCHLDVLGADAGDRFTHMIAHELAHVQQPAAQADPPPGTPLLPQALLEGGAELLAELTSGRVSYGHMAAWTKGKECEIEQAFSKDASGSDTSHWLYNGFGTSDKPGDLGYWVGYRITKAYYEHAADKRQAVADILGITPDNATAFLARSGWKPQAGC